MSIKEWLTCPINELTDFYEYLSIPYTNDISVIKKACNLKSFQIHPDRNKRPTANDEFVDFLIIRDVLFTHKKVNYDQRYFTYKKNKGEDVTKEWGVYNTELNYQNICRHYFDKWWTINEINLRNAKFTKSNEFITGIFCDFLSLKNPYLIKSFNDMSIDFSPFQYRPLQKFLKAKTDGILIADDVGIGKTIETGIIIHELDIRNELNSVLIICPNSLTRKWQSELSEKFNRTFKIIDFKQLIEFIYVGNQYAKAYFIISFDKIKNPMASLSDEENELFIKKKLFSLLVFDEAHHAKNKNTNIYGAILKIRRICEKAILLTATPIHNSPKDLYNLLTIIDDSLFENEYIFKSITQKNSVINQTINYLKEYDEDGDYLKQNIEIEEALVDIFSTNNEWISFIYSKYPIRSILASLRKKEIFKLEQRNRTVDILERANPLGYIINRTRKKDIEKFTKRKVVNIHTHFTNNENLFYNGIIKYFIEKCAKNDKHILSIKNRKVNYFITCGIEKVLASSIRNFTDEKALEHFCKRMTIKELFNTLGDDPSIKELAADITNLPLNDINFSKFKDLANKINSQPDDKVNKLIEYIRKIFDSIKFNKLIIFSSYKKTLRYLAEIIKLNFPDKNICIISGDNKESEREKIRERFSYGKSNPERIDILLSSEISGEGLDFQFCSAIINYDMPWNPMKIEQRIGRIDRRGQQSEIIYIFNFYNSETIEGKIYDICMQKINIFENLIGGLDPIIKSVEKIVVEEQFDAFLTKKEKNELNELTKANYEKEIKILSQEAKDIHSYYHKDVIDEKEWLEIMFSSIIKNYFTALLPIDSFDITNFNDKLEIVLKTNEAKNIVINELKRLFSAPVSKESTYLNVITRQKNKPKDYVSLLENVQNNKISISYSYDDAFLKLAVFSSPFKSFAKICKVVIDDKEILERGKYFFSIYTYEVKNVQKMFALVKNITNGKTSVMEVNHLFKIFKLMIDDQNTQCDWGKIPEYSMTTSQMAFDHVNNLINDIYTKDLQTFEDRKQIKKMIHERKARKISDMIRKTFDEIKLLDGLIAWESGGRKNDYYDWYNGSLGRTLEEMKEKRINLEKNLHINMKWLENLATEFNEYYRLNEDKKPIKAPFSIELNSVGFLTNQVIKKS